MTQQAAVKVADAVGRQGRQVQTSKVKSKPHGVPLLCLMLAVLAHDLDTITFYDSKGEFVGVRRSSSGKPIQVNSGAL
jgi:hypothetical protein